MKNLLLMIVLCLGLVSVGISKEAEKISLHSDRGISCQPCERNNNAPSISACPNQPTCSISKNIEKGFGGLIVVFFLFGLFLIPVFFFFILIILLITPAIFYLLTLQKTLNKCKIENRTLSPELVWLNLIPFFNLYWHFVIVLRLSSSLDNEFKNRQIKAEPFPGKSLGLAMCILSACSIVPVLGSLSFIAYIVCWICYWVKIANYSKLLNTEQPSAIISADKI